MKVFFFGKKGCKRGGGIPIPPKNALIRRPSDRKCKVVGDGYSNNAPLCVFAILHQVLLHPPTATLSVVYVPTTAKHI